ncbi:MAG: hypothetical protein ACYCWW_03240 [Deltaproteobacteria bacterium]
MLDHATTPTLRHQPLAHLVELQRSPKRVSQRGVGGDPCVLPAAAALEVDARPKGTLVIEDEPRGDPAAEGPSQAERACH